MLPWRLQHLDKVIKLWLDRKPVRRPLIELSRPSASGNASQSHDQPYQQ